VQLSWLKKLEEFVTKAQNVSKAIVFHHAQMRDPSKQTGSLALISQVGHSAKSIVLLGMFSKIGVYEHG
jgi:hypothetical protein